MLENYFKNTFIADCRHLSNKAPKNAFSKASKRLRKSEVRNESEVNQ